MWKTSRREIPLTHPLVIAILNVTPDSFSDGGRYSSIDAALKRAEEMISEGADIIDVGGESTRPGSARVSLADEIERVIPVVRVIAARFDVPISVDTSKSEVALAAIDAGAEIINDISGLRFDPKIADVAAETGAGLVLMHSRGEFETMHSQPPIDDIIAEVAADFRRSTALAGASGVAGAQIVLDIGIGFGKTLDQNLELLAKLDRLIADFPQFPMLVGASRKSFIGKLLDDAPTDKRLFGSLAAAAIAVWNGARIIRAHDIEETVETIRLVINIRQQI
ncbi:MAG: dihydropteroate synthase [Chloracidobacterium sp.]|nr:dihydropteroate synthase [Chloracidobacterium sp.]